MRRVGIFAATRILAASSSSTSWWTPAITAALVAAAVALTTFVLAGRRARLDRQRQVFAEAFEAVMEYREYPFIVRRRATADAAAERARISGDLSEVQARINAYKARLRVEEPLVGKRYAELVAETKKIAGAMIIEAWNDSPVTDDSNVHNPGWDFSGLDAFDDAYLNSVADHLSWLHAPIRRWLREQRQGREKNR